MSTVQWGIQYTDSKLIRPAPSEQEARAVAQEHNDIDKSGWAQPFDMIAVSRTVSEWSAG